MTSLFVEQPNLWLKIAAALCKTVLKLGSIAKFRVAKEYLDTFNMLQLAYMYS